jgi:hypothetical protein
MLLATHTAVQCNAMTITRTFCSASLLAPAAIMGPVVRGYAREPCCDWVYGKYINLKTGKEGWLLP